MNKMIKSVGGPEQELPSKMTFFGKFVYFCWPPKQRVEFKFYAFVSDIDFTNLLHLRDETNYVDCQMSTCLRR